MTRIKICGITNIDDALLAADVGADALGFIGVPASPRYVTPATYAQIAQALPPFVTRVVVVHRPEDATEYKADLVQHYADEDDTGSDPPAPAARRIRAFRIRDEHSLNELASYAVPVAAVLLDAFHPDKLGGAGQAFDWRLALRARSLTSKPILLAGGLTSDNITAALHAVHPYGVDIASGVEASPGLKDPAKLRAFIRAVRDWDLQNRL